MVLWLAVARDNPSGVAGNMHVSRAFFHPTSTPRFSWNPKLYRLINLIRLVNTTDILFVLNCIYAGRRVPFGHVDASFLPSPCLPAVQASSFCKIESG